MIRCIFLKSGQYGNLVWTEALVSARALPAPGSFLSFTPDFCIIIDGFNISRWKGAQSSRRIPTYTHAEGITGSLPQETKTDCIDDSNLEHSTHYSRPSGTEEETALTGRYGHFHLVLATFHYFLESTSPY